MEDKGGPVYSDIETERRAVQDARQRLERGIARDDANATRAGLVMLGEAIASGRDESSAWGMILGLVEQRRKLVETERKHLADEDRFIISVMGSR